jgi:predicted DsbA family dithiol-disulfide isomerase
VTDLRAPPPLPGRAAAPYAPAMEKRLRVDVWSDIACPWCYVGKRRLEAAIARFNRPGSVDVVWRAFELDPDAPPAREAVVSYPARLAKKYGMPLADAEARIRQLTELAAKDGLELHFERVRPGNTFDAHRVLHFAAERGVQGAVKERLLRAYMSEGESIGDPATLARLAGEAGLDPSEVRRVLASDAGAAEVREDEQEAQALGIHGVPFFVLDRRLGISGAQPVDVLVGALDEAWAGLADDAGKESAASEEGAACGPDGCA